MRIQLSKPSNELHVLDPHRSSHSRPLLLDQLFQVDGLEAASKLSMLKSMLKSLQKKVCKSLSMLKY